MAFTTPATAVAGTVLTAGWLNTYVRDNVAWIATDSPSCSVYNSANLSTTTAVELVLTFNSERFDNAAMHDTGSNTSRITTPTGGAGKYIVGADVSYAANGTGVRALAIQYNGSSANRYASMDTASNGSGTFPTDVAPVAIVSLAAADYSEAIAFQTSGGNLNVTATGLYSPIFWGYWFRT